MEVELFTTIPESIKSDRTQFVDELKRISIQSENHGYKGILVYSDNRLADPWIVTELILNHTRKLLPMVALQPFYMHPYTVAKKISSIALIHGRRISLNLVAGGYINDLKALGDTTDHDRRYDRLIEYTEIIQQLLTSPGPVTYEGEFYNVKNLKLEPKIPADLLPLYYLSGSSKAAKNAADKLNAKLILYPEPIKDGEESSWNVSGIRIGILARPTNDRAWSDAHERFPATRIGEISHQLAKKTSDSEWHKNLSNHSVNGHVSEEKSVYWLGPFEHYHTFCPYLVGEYNEVAEALSGYIKAGCTTCIVDTPISELELQSTMNVFDRVHEKFKKERTLQ